MPDSNKGGATKKMDTIEEFLKAPVKNSEEKVKEAGTAKKSAEANLNTTNADLGKLKERVEYINKQLKTLDGVTASFNRIDASGKLASKLAATASGADVAQSITDSAKTVKALLDSIDPVYPDAISMNARVTTIDKDSDSTQTKDYVAAYMEKAKLATDAADNWKTKSLELAKNLSSFLKVDVDGNVGKIQDLSTAIGALGADVDTTVQDWQSMKDQDTSAENDLRALISENNLAIAQNDVIITAGNSFAGKKEPKTDEGSTSKSKKQ